MVRLCNPTARGAEMTEHTIELVDDNLAFCTTCKCGEGELTTECCGRRATDEERHRIYKLGTLDFIDGKWRPQ